MSPTPRLKAGIFVRALIRRVQVEGANAVIVRKGNEEAGALVIRVVRPGGDMLVLNQARRGDGQLVWARPLGDWGPAQKAEHWCRKQEGFDPDLWIVEIEDRDGRAFVDEPIV